MRRVVALWEKMNRWIEGLAQSYERMRVSFDQLLL